MKNQHRGVISLYGTGIALFFTIALVFVIIFVNIGFSVNNSQKAVVQDAYDEVRELLEVSGKISAVADVKTNQIKITVIPVRVANGGIVNLNPETTNIAYNLTHQSNVVSNYEDIYADRLTDRTFNSVKDAVKEAKNQGIIEINPFVDEQKPTTTTAFVYWVLNQNFDHFVDDGELAVIAVVYSAYDMPSGGDKLFLEVNISEGHVLRIDEEVPDISNEVLNFGGILIES